MRALLRYVEDLDCFAAWLVEHGVWLVDAAALLGGPGWHESRRSTLREAVLEMIGNFPEEAVQCHASAAIAQDF